ncbi:unnamed protein product, partial [Ixodes persulcatus]
KPGIVVLQRLQLHLPLLGPDALRCSLPLCQGEFEPIVFVAQLCLGRRLGQRCLVASPSRLVLGTARLQARKALAALVRHQGRPPVALAGRGRAHRRRARRARAAVSLLRRQPSRLLHLLELLDELHGSARTGALTVRFRAETQAVDGVGANVGPLAKLLGGLGERHVGRDGGRGSAYLGSFDADDAVQVAGGVEEEAHAHCLAAGGDPGPLRLGVDVEHVRFRGKDGLLPAT